MITDHEISINALRRGTSRQANRVTNSHTRDAPIHSQVSIIEIYIHVEEVQTGLPFTFTVKPTVSSTDKGNKMFNRINDPINRILHSIKNSTEENWDPLMQNALVDNCCLSSRPLFSTGFRNLPAPALTRLTPRVQRNGNSRSNKSRKLARR